MPATPAATAPFSPPRRAVLATTFIAALALMPLLAPQAAQASPLEGSGTPVTETRTVAAFDGIALSGSLDLVVRQGAQQSVQVQADDNLLPLLETVVEPARNGGSTLKVRWKREGGWGGSWNSGWNRVQPRTKVLVTVVVPTLTSVAVAGSGDARLQGLNTEDLSVRISGSGDVIGQGSATRLKISIAGSGDVRLAEMRSEEVSVSIAGSGDAAVNAQKALSVSIAGSGDVSYTGEAQVKSSVAGSGSVRRKP